MAFIKLGGNGTNAKCCENMETKTIGYWETGKQSLLQENRETIQLNIEQGNEASCFSPYKLVL